jgi:hypothetical protein
MAHLFSGLPLARAIINDKTLFCEVNSVMEIAELQHIVRTMRLEKFS